MKKQQESASKKTSKRAKQSIVLTSPVNPPSDSKSLQESDNDEGIQSHEISNDEYSICFGLYQDELSSTGKILTDWVNCTNPRCGKWMH